jgi:subtilisin family serine protease
MGDSPQAELRRQLVRMRRRNLLIMLFVAVAIWALMLPDTESALAKAADNAPASALVASASARLDDEAEMPPEPAEGRPSLDVGETPASPADQSQTIAVSEAPTREQPILGDANLASLRQVTTGNSQTIVAVLDTGIDGSHQELSGKVIGEINLTDSPTPSDIHGHGTHVAGIIGAADDAVGVSGLAPGCLLLNVKVADDIGICQSSALAQGIIWAVDNGASVINISIEFAEPSPELEKALDYAWEQGALTVAAAGNRSSQAPAYPAYYQNCLSVSAVNQDNNLVQLSNRGDWVDVLAPGYNVYSTLPDNSYGYKTGTSFACAYVSGLAALLFDMATDTNQNGRINDEVRAIIESGGYQIDTAVTG